MTCKGVKLYLKGDILIIKESFYTFCDIVLRNIPTFVPEMI